MYYIILFFIIFLRTILPSIFIWWLNFTVRKIKKLTTVKKIIKYLVVKSCLEYSHQHDYRLMDSNKNYAARILLYILCWMKILIFNFFFFFCRPSWSMDAGITRMSLQPRFSQAGLRLLCTTGWMPMRRTSA